MLTKFVDYCKLSYNELAHKTTWPTAKQLTSQAFLVLYSSLVLALAIFAVDQFFNFIMQLVYPH